MWLAERTSLWLPLATAVLDEVHLDVARARLQALAEGTMIASKHLCGKVGTWQLVFSGRCDGNVLQAGSERPRAVVSVAADTSLVCVLRNDLALNGPKFGCGLAQCGACAVLKDGRETRSCVTPVAAAGARNIATSEGPGCLHPLPTAFVEKQAAHCRYCTSGMLIAAVGLLPANPEPTEDEIKQPMDGHLCRCASHVRIVEAIVRPARAEVPI
jgi:nicotinate dehydrogenase subunit A